MHRMRAGQHLMGKHWMGLGPVSSGSQHASSPLPQQLVELRNEH